MGVASTVRAMVSGDGPTPTGNVKFYDGPDYLGTAALDADGMASLEISGTNRAGPPGTCGPSLSAMTSTERR